MSYKSNTKFAWVIFIGILFIELGIDYILRITSDSFRYSGIPETIWFSIHIMAAVIAVYFIVLGMKCLKSLQSKIIYIATNFVIGMILYISITGLYILGLGIDSL